MIIDQVTGADFTSTSIVASGGVTAPDVLPAGGPVILMPYRLGGTAGICVGASMAVDIYGEPQRGAATTYTTAISTTTSPFGAQAIPTTGAIVVTVTVSLTQLSAWLGVYSGKGGSLRGFNMAGATPAPTTIAPANTLSYVGASASKVQGDAAQPGDVILITRNGFGIVFAHDGSAGGSPVNGASGTDLTQLSHIATAASAAPATGTMSYSHASLIVQRAQAVTPDNPGTYSATGVQMACRAWINGF